MKSKKVDTLEHIENTIQQWKQRCVSESEALDIIQDELNDYHQWEEAEDRKRREELFRQNSEIVELPVRYVGKLPTRERVKEEKGFVQYTVFVREGIYGKEYTTNDIVFMEKEKTCHLDEDGIIKIGTFINEDGILVGKLTPKLKNDMTEEEKKLLKIQGLTATNFRDTSLRLPYGKSGVVVGTKLNKNPLHLPDGVLEEITIFIELD